MLNFLSSSGSKQQVVGISVTPGIGLEVALLDPSGRGVASYGRKKIEYNFSTREIQNYADFKNSLIDLITELQIPQKSILIL